MGNALESLSPRRGVKRSREELEESQEKDNGNTTKPTPGDFQTPKRKRSQSTAKYILKTLFEEGNESDITILACGQEWRLHKLYLCQCRYFDSMFNGPWREADQSVVNMEITDENIDPKALKIAFQSLYTDNIFVKPVEAVGVLAAATLLQLDPLIEHCKTVMKGCIAEDLLLTLLSSPDLWLMQVEVDIYTLLKKWIFIQLNPTWNEGGICFLETETGWLEPFFSHCWTHHLMIEQAVDKGPQRVSEEEFLEKSMRCGRILIQEQDYCWRWVGYNFGMDLLLTCRNRVLMMKRNGGSRQFDGLISQQLQRHVMIRLSLAVMRKKDPSPVVHSTGIKTLTLVPDEVGRTAILIIVMQWSMKDTSYVVTVEVFSKPTTNLKLCRTAGVNARAKHM
ncbi:hypothetical protein BaRGS_00010173 [Batillaria attramentaria]|uniref:BTB domain-containing protein n=1 Tax=Batillaria attramentaria TaxID=370345 RepID=A0ABD0LHC3_9CAEN